MVECVVSLQLEIDGELLIKLSFLLAIQKRNSNIYVFPLGVTENRSVCLCGMVQIKILNWFLEILKCLKYDFKDHDIKGL